MPVLLFFGIVYLIYAIVMLYVGQFCPAIFLLFLAYIVLRCEKTRANLDDRSDD